MFTALPRAAVVEVAIALWYGFCLCFIGQFLTARCSVRDRSLNHEHHVMAHRALSSFRDLVHLFPILRPRLHLYEGQINRLDGHTYLMMDQWRKCLVGHSHAPRFAKHTRASNTIARYSAETPVLFLRRLWRGKWSCRGRSRARTTSWRCGGSTPRPRRSSPARLSAAPTSRRRVPPPHSSLNDALRAALHYQPWLQNCSNQSDDEHNVRVAVGAARIHGT